MIENIILTVFSTAKILNFNELYNFLFIYLSTILLKLIPPTGFLRKITSIDFLETDMVYYDNRYVTYRILWTSPDLPTGIKNVTYISFRVASGSVKMVGYSSIS